MAHAHFIGYITVMKHLFYAIQIILKSQEGKGENSKPVFFSFLPLYPIKQKSIRG